MRKNMLREAENYAVRKRRHRIWMKVVAGLACVVVFCTTYALILPAITLEKTPECGKTEHTHDEACYTQVTAASKTVPVCTPERLGLHKHTDACLDEKGAYCCGYADFVIHMHDSACYDADGKLWCPLPEAEAHTHTAGCYATERGRLLCGEEEGEGHVHSREAGCYDESGELICQAEESEGHRHTDDCYEQTKVLICDKAERIPHEHTSDCFAKDGEGNQTTELICGKRQILEHQHTGACFRTAEEPVDTETLTCKLEESEDHRHGPLCYGTWELTCGLEEHTHSDLCLKSAVLEAESEHARLTAVCPVGHVQEGTRLVLREYAPQSEEYSVREQRISESLADPDLALLTVYSFDYRFENEAGEMVKPEGDVLLTLSFPEPLSPGESLASGAAAGPEKDETATGQDAAPLKEEASLPTEEPGKTGSTGARWTIYELDGERPAQLPDVEPALDSSGAVVSLAFPASQEEGRLAVASLCSTAALNEKSGMGYIYDLTVKTTNDGTAPFDPEEKPGNDTGPANGIVRSFDTVGYELAMNFGARNNTATAKSAMLHFEMTLEEDITTAVFDLEQMGWVKENCKIQCLDSSGKVVLTRNADGNYYNPAGKVVDLNAYVSGSLQGTGSYKTAIVKQVLTGSYELKAEGATDNVLSGDKTLSAGIQLYNADHDHQIAPRFRLWLDDNEENYKEEGTSGEKVPNTQGAAPVTVSAGANFNLQLCKNVDMTYKNWFDFSTGDIVDAETRADLERLALLSGNAGKANPADFVDEQGSPLDETTKAKYATIRYGRMSGYGVTLQLYNTLPDKGMRGFSLPTGEIQFRLNFTSKALSDGQVIDETNFTPILWDYKENINNGDTDCRGNYADRGTVVIEKSANGKAGRRVYWNSESRSSYGKGAGPSNYRFFTDGCYYGGAWRMDGVGSPSDVSGTGSSKFYTFTVEDFDFDFNRWSFPVRDAGNSGGLSVYTTNARCFSAGYAQVLSIFPRNLKQPVVDLELTATVSDLSLTTRDGQSHRFEGAMGEGTAKDNSRRDKLDLYALGGLTKGNAFNERGAKTTVDRYLGTDYWTTAYDCSTFAGDDISIVSYGFLNSNSDYRMKSLNLLQLFDSRALSINGEMAVHKALGDLDTAGEETFLYVADPDYPGGYDTNQPGVLAYMNGVREEDLKYYSSLDALQADGYTCVGALMELRKCDIMGGRYQYFAIPVHVNGEDPELVNRTVATVNALRVWTDESDLRKPDGTYASWKDGVWDEEKGKNTLDGYTAPTGFNQATGTYSTEFANKEHGFPAYYVKTEYANGKQVSGTHAGGVQAGNSLLILGYKAGISIVADQESYDMDKGETTVNYTLTNIETKLRDSTGQTERPKTTLTIPVTVDSANQNGDGVHLNMGAYTLRGYEVGENEEPVGEEKTFTISTSAKAPTKVGFYVGETFYTFTIYAEEKANVNAKEVVFHLAEVPVGIMLPEIHFRAGLENSMKNNATIDTTANISGAGDCRAYSKTAGNTSTATVSVIKLSGSFLNKEVDRILTELDQEIHYRVTYFNNSASVSPWLYFYDLLPYGGDGRGTHYDGTLSLSSFALGWKDAGHQTLTEQPVGVETELYYSTEAPATLAPLLSGFNGTAGDGPANEETLNQLLRSEKFQPLDPDNLPPNRAVTCVFMKVNQLPANYTVELNIGVKPQGNAAGDLYGNTACSWWGAENRNPLKSKLVQTAVVAREISGLVWYDKDLDGVRDDGEPLLKDVTVTLFAWDKGKKTYVECKTDVTDGKIQPMVTGEDGAYCFGKLPQGKYLVAFGGDALKAFTGATAYQVTGADVSVNSDGKALTQAFPGIDKETYSYYISYGDKSPEITLHAPEEIQNANSMERVDHQDLGLMIATHELPQTGGAGTSLYTWGGLLLCSGAYLLYKCTKRRREGASS